MEAGTGVRGCAYVVQTGDGRAMAGQAGKRTPEEKLAGIARTGVGVASNQIDIRVRQVSRRNYNPLSHGRCEIGNLALQLLNDAVGVMFAKRFGPPAIGGVDNPSGITRRMAGKFLKLQPEYPGAFGTTRRIDCDGLAEHYCGISGKESSFGFIDGARNSVKTVANVQDGRAVQARVVIFPAGRFGESDVDLHVSTAETESFCIFGDPSWHVAGIQQREIELIGRDIANNGAARFDYFSFSPDANRAAVSDFNALDVGIRFESSTKILDQFYQRAGQSGSPAFRDRHSAQLQGDGNQFVHVARGGIVRAETRM